jgi:hypothetical protein
MVLVEYIAIVVLGGMVAVFSAGMPSRGVEPAPLVFWVLANMLGEALWLPAPGKRGYLSMATTANFAAILVLPTPLAIFVTAASGALVDVLFRSRRWYQVLFNTAVTCAATFTASRVFLLAGLGPGDLAQLVSPLNILGVALAAAVYFFINTWLVSGAIALDQSLVACDVWSNTFATRREVVGSLVLFLLGFLFAVLYLTWGYVSAFLISGAAYFVREAYRHYVTASPAAAASGRD